MEDGGGLVVDVGDVLVEVGSGVDVGVVGVVADGVDSDVGDGEVTVSVGLSVGVGV